MFEEIFDREVYKRIYQKYDEFYNHIVSCNRKEKDFDAHLISIYGPGGRGKSATAKWMYKKIADSDNDAILIDLKNGNFSRLLENKEKRYIVPYIYIDVICSFLKQIKDSPLENVKNLYKKATELIGLWNVFCDKENLSDLKYELKFSPFKGIIDADLGTELIESTGIIDKAVERFAMFAEPAAVLITNIGRNLFEEGKEKITEDIKNKFYTSIEKEYSRNVLRYINDNFSLKNNALCKVFNSFLQDLIDAGFHKFKPILLIIDEFEDIDVDDVDTIEALKDMMIVENSPFIFFISGRERVFDSLETETKYYLPDEELFFTIDETRQLISDIWDGKIDKKPITDEMIETLWIKSRRNARFLQLIVSSFKNRMTSEDFYRVIDSPIESSFIEFAKNPEKGTDNYKSIVLHSLLTSGSRDLYALISKECGFEDTSLKYGFIVSAKGNQVVTYPDVGEILLESIKNEFNKDISELHEMSNTVKELVVQISDAINSISLSELNSQYDIYSILKYHKDNFYDGGYNKIYSLLVRVPESSYSKKRDFEKNTKLVHSFAAKMLSESENIDYYFNISDLLSLKERENYVYHCYKALLANDQIVISSYDLTPTPTQLVRIHTKAMDLLRPEYVEEYIVDSINYLDIINKASLNLFDLTNIKMEDNSDWNFYSSDIHKQYKYLTRSNYHDYLNLMNTWNDINSIIYYHSSESADYRRSRYLLLFKQVIKNIYELMNELPDVDFIAEYHESLINKIESLWIDEDEKLILKLDTANYYYVLNKDLNSYLSVLKQSISEYNKSNNIRLITEILRSLCLVSFSYDTVEEYGIEYIISDVIISRNKESLMNLDILEERAFYDAAIHFMTQYNIKQPILLNDNFDIDQYDYPLIEFLIKDYLFAQRVDLAIIVLNSFIKVQDDLLNDIENNINTHENLTNEEIEELNKTKDELLIHSHIKYLFDLIFSLMNIDGYYNLGNSIKDEFERNIIKFYVSKQNNSNDQESYIEVDSKLMVLLSFLAGEHFDDDEIPGLIENYLFATKRIDKKINLNLSLLTLKFKDFDFVEIIDYAVEEHMKNHPFLFGDYELSEILNLRYFYRLLEAYVPKENIADEMINCIVYSEDKNKYIERIENKYNYLKQIDITDRIDLSKTLCNIYERLENVSMVDILEYIITNMIDYQITSGALYEGQTPESIYIWRQFYAVFDDVYKNKNLTKDEFASLMNNITDYYCEYLEKLISVALGDLIDYINQVLSMNDYFDDTETQYNILSKIVNKLNSISQSDNHFLADLYSFKLFVMRIRSEYCCYLIKDYKRTLEDVDKCINECIEAMHYVGIQTVNTTLLDTGHFLYENINLFNKKDVLDRLKTILSIDELDILTKDSIKEIIDTI